MPNHTSNRLTMRGSNSEVARFVNENKSEETDDVGSPIPLSFEKLVPTPPEMLESNDIKNGKMPDWYNWRVENWGTKWDVSELDIEYDEEVLELTFSTAWSPPEGIMQELKDKYPDLGFSCFYDEPGMEIAGYY